MDLLNPANPMNMVNPASPWYHVWNPSDGKPQPQEVIQVTADVHDTATAFGLFGVITLMGVLVAALALFIWVIFFKD